MPRNLREMLAEIAALDRVFLAPDIPKKKLRAARAAHAHHLPADEPVVALYDDTMFGKGDDGFVLTHERICWKNVLESPQQIALADLGAGSIGIGDGGVELAGGQVNIAMSPDLPGPLVELLKRLAGAVPSPSGTPETPEALIREIALRHIGKHQDVFYAPGLPPRKASGAATAHAAHLEAGESIVVLFDDTVFGSAEEGFIFTPLRLAWKEIMEDPNQLRWEDVDPDNVRIEDGGIGIAGGKIAITQRETLVQPAAAAIREIARAARGELPSQAEPEPVAVPTPAPVPAPDEAVKPGYERCNYCGRRVPLDTWLSCPGCGASL